MNQRFVKIEEGLELKADKAAHDSLATKVESLKPKGPEFGSQLGRSEKIN